MDFSAFEKMLGIVFVDKKILEEALIHRSYLNEHPEYKGSHNERLEFLGDAVLELAVTEYLYQNFSNKSEGEMTAWRAALVNADTLGELAQYLDLNEFLQLSRGEAKDTGRARLYLLANAFEALIGALYLDQGYQAAVSFLHKYLLPKLPDIIKQGLWRDPKSSFQEEAQERVGITPTYQVLAEWGPDHARQFRIGVFLGDDLIAEGEGPSKQAAQVKAAEAALEKTGWNQ